MSSSRGVWIRPVWAGSESEQPDSDGKVFLYVCYSKSPLRRHVPFFRVPKDDCSPSICISDNSVLTLGREFVANVALDRDRPVESVSRRAVTLQINSAGQILLENVRSEFLRTFSATFTLSIG